MSDSPYAKRVADTLVSKEAFNDTVYTNLGVAIEELGSRRENNDLEILVSEFLGKDIPEVFQNEPRVALFRQVTTPNYEVRRFMSVPDATGIPPVFLEYLDDKFTSNNTLKYYLGRFGFYMGKNKHGQDIIHYKNIIDFVSSDGKRINEVTTLWGQPLVEFCHELYGRAYPDAGQPFCDISHWLHDHGHTARGYYRNVLALFIRNGILFENFIHEGEERTFTEDVFLPAFFELWDLMGYKPLIVALEPTDIEDDVFWMCHPSDTKSYVEEKITSAQDSHRVVGDSMPPLVS